MCVGSRFTPGHHFPFPGACVGTGRSLPCPAPSPCVCPWRGESGLLFCVCEIVLRLQPLGGTWIYTLYIYVLRDLMSFYVHSLGGGGMYCLVLMSPFHVVKEQYRVIILFFFFLCRVIFFFLI